MSKPLAAHLCRVLVAAMIVMALPAASHGQSVAGLYVQVNGLTSRIQAAQQQTLRNGMNTPAIKKAYQRYYRNIRARGQRPMPYTNFAYQYMATGGFTRGGEALLARSNAMNSARIASANADYRNAAAARGQVQLNGQIDAANRSYQAGQVIAGTSTFHAPNGQAMELPHTWQVNTTNVYNGGTYRVDESGHYWAWGGNGWIALRK